MSKHLHLWQGIKKMVASGSLVLAAIMIFLVFSVIYIRNTEKEYSQHAYDHAMNQSAAAASFIHADLVREIPVEQSAYTYIKNGLMEFKEQNNEVHYAYLCSRAEDGSIVLLADSQPPQSPDYVLSEDMVSSIDQVFVNGTSVAASPAAGRLSARLRTFVPVKDYGKSDIVAVLGMEYDAAYWRHEVYKHIIHAIVVVVCITLLLVIIYWAILRNKTLHTLSGKLKSSESLFRTVFEQAPIGIAIGKDDKLISDINPVFIKIQGRTKEELTTTNWAEYTHPDDLKKDLELFKQFQQREIPGYSMKKRFIRPEGSVVWVDMTVAPLAMEGASEHSGKHLCLIEDITDRIEAQKAQQESERSKAVLLSHLPGMAYRCYYNKEWTMQFVSDGCFALTGYQPESLLYNKELSYNDLIAPEYRDSIWKEWERVVAQKRPFRYEYKIIPAGGNRKWVLEMGQAVYDDEGNVDALEGIIIDITDQKMREAQIQYMGDHDHMTGLFNRRYFEEMKKQMDTANSLPLSIIVTDINGVRLINDAFGHAEGDRVIIETAYVLRGCCRKGEILARTGANEFSILMTGTDTKEVNEMVKAIRKASDRYNKTLKTRSYDISLSIGHATKTNPAESIDQTAKAAEDYMHNRKLLDRRGSHSTLLNSIMATMYERSQETEEHAERLALLAKMVGSRLSLPQKNLHELELLSMLHDIGKVGIDDSILNKPGKLNDEEWAEMKKHPEIGYRIAMTSPELEPIAEYILSHHERWDGTGYPRGLQGEDIPLLARILAVVDAYDAMTEDRVYRKAMTNEAAKAEISRNAGTQFDPEIARIFIESLSE